MKENKKGNKRFLLAMLAVTLVLGLVLAGCPTDSGGGNSIPGDDGVAKSITITNVSGINTVMLLNSTSGGNEGIVAMGTGTISNMELTVALKTGNTGSGSNWTGTGSYWLAISAGGPVLVYTGGAAIPANLNDLPKSASPVQIHRLNLTILCLSPSN